VVRATIFIQKCASNNQLDQAKSVSSQIATEGLLLGSRTTVYIPFAAQAGVRINFLRYASSFKTCKEGVMITRRDMFVALIAILVTAGGFAIADSGPAMGSSAFDWNAVPVKATDVGSVRSFFKTRTPTIEELEVHATTLDPGKSPHPPHRHPNEEMIIIRQGTVEALVNGTWKRVGPGSVVFFASNQLHGLRNVGTEQAIYHVINWKTAATPAAIAP
jgi:quercetin dioxygenase-like cupin family protein